MSLGWVKLAVNANMAVRGMKLEGLGNVGNEGMDIVQMCWIRMWIFKE